MIPFGGWLMPVQYTSIVEEHQAVRNNVGIFDISHMGQLIVEGTGAREWLNTHADKQHRQARSRRGSIHVSAERGRRHHRRPDRLSDWRREISAGRQRVAHGRRFCLAATAIVRLQTQFNSPIAARILAASPFRVHGLSSCFTRCSAVIPICRRETQIVDLPVRWNACLRSRARVTPAKTASKFSFAANDAANFWNASSRKRQAVRD